METSEFKRRLKGEGTVDEDRKQKRSGGKSYITKRNIVREAKVEPKNEVICKCKYGCKEISNEQKSKLFYEFYALNDYVKQNSYLMGLFVIVPVKRRRHGQYADPQESKRQTTLCFSLPDGKGNVIQTCKKTFMNVFAITKRRIETLASAKKQGDLVYIEKRGNKTKHRKYNVDDETLVVQHINSLPRDVSHYGRRDSQKEYLSQDLNVNRLYSAFLNKFPQTNIKYRFYYETFKNKFPLLSFHRPRTDTCTKCDILSAELKANPNCNIKQKVLKLHHLKAGKARKIMADDHKSSQLPTSEICTASMDLEQVFSLPSLTHSQMYYLRQLSCYNLGIHIGDNNKGYMFLWNKSISGRGGNEIASCVFKAVTSQVTQKRNLTIWSDNCAAQNKNKMLIFLWSYLIGKGYFDEINQKYLVSGHSFLSCDRDFAQIEKRKKCERCEVPVDLVKLMVTATPNNPFIVTVMQSEDFYDFKAAADKTINTSKMEISKLSWIKMTKTDPGCVHMRKTFNEIEEWKRMKIFKKGVTIDKIRRLQLPELECVNRISQEKKKDLSQIIPFLKPENKAFYEKIIQ